MVTSFNIIKIAIEKSPESHFGGRFYCRKGNHNTPMSPLFKDAAYEDESYVLAIFSVVYVT